MNVKYNDNAISWFMRTASTAFQSFFNKQIHAQLQLKWIRSSAWILVYSEYLSIQMCWIYFLKTTLKHQNNAENITYCSASSVITWQPFKLNAFRNPPHRLDIFSTTEAWKYRKQDYSLWFKVCCFEGIQENVPRVKGWTFKVCSIST